METGVRRAVTSDAEPIALVHVRGWQVAYRGLLPDSYLDQLSLEHERRTQFWKTEITFPTMPGHEVWVSKSGTQVHGFASIGPSRDADLAAAGEIYAIYVDPSQWGRGLGRELLMYASNRLTELGYTQAMLWVLDSNAQARRFYEIAGWTADGATKIETRPGFELREVRYKKSFRRNEE